MCDRSRAAATCSRTAAETHDEPDRFLDQPASSVPPSPVVGKLCSVSGSSLSALDLVADLTLGMHPHRPRRIAASAKPRKWFRQIPRPRVPAVVSARTSCSNGSVRGAWASVYMAEQEQPVRRRGRAQDHQTWHGLRARHRPVRGRTPGPGPDGSPEHLYVSWMLGTNDTGRPFFVMELAHGVSITAYCDRTVINSR